MTLLAIKLMVAACVIKIPDDKTIYPRIISTICMFKVNNNPIKVKDKAQIIVFLDP